MPNWCENDLFIIGPTRNIEEFAALAQGETPFDFDRFIPYPDDYREPDEAAARWDEDHAKKPDADWTRRPKDGFNNGGYDWCVMNWGTKWLAARVEREGPIASDADGQSQVVFSFTTAWFPPLAIIRAAAERFPSLEFELRYFERGAAFSGVLICKNGEVSFSETRPYYGDRGG